MTATQFEKNKTPGCSDWDFGAAGMVDLQIIPHPSFQRISWAILLSSVYLITNNWFISAYYKKYVSRSAYSQENHV